MYSEVGVAVGDVQVPVGGLGDVGGHVEGTCLMGAGIHLGRAGVWLTLPAGLTWAVAVGDSGVRRLVPGPEPHQLVALGVVLKHYVAVLDGQVQVVVSVHVHAVGVDQVTLSPGRKKVAVAVKDHQGMVAPVETVEPGPGSQ